MDDDLILMATRGEVAWLTLNRPAQANTINSAIATMAIEALADIVPAVRAVIITGSGRHFCGGADLKTFAEQQAAGDPNPTARLCEALAAIEIPVIAAINGAAVGGGCEIALASDFRFMSRAASIAFAEIRFGYLPAAGGTQRLPRLVGPTNAMRLIMTGAAMSAEDAVRIGFAEVMCDPDDLVADAQTFAEELAARPRYALVAAKRLVRASMELPLAAGLEHETETLATMATPAERDAEKLRARTGDNTYRKLFK